MEADMPVAKSVAGKPGQAGTGSQTLKPPNLPLKPVPHKAVPQPPKVEVERGQGEGKKKARSAQGQGSKPKPKAQPKEGSRKVVVGLTLNLIAAQPLYKLTNLRATS